MSCKKLPYVLCPICFLEWIYSDGDIPPSVAHDISVRSLPFLDLRNCAKITYAIFLSKSSYAALSSVGNARISSFFRLAYGDLSCAICTSYFRTVPNILFFSGAEPAGMVPHPDMRIFY